MKRFFFIFLFLPTCILCSAQSPRMVLIEEFTSATCGPSALWDPYLDTLIWANTTKVVALKYQGPPYPNADVMYDHNPADVDNRSLYYSVPYVPYARIDGVIPGISSPNIMDIDQALIDGFVAIPSSFSININDSINSMGDSMFISIDVMCTQNISMTTPKLRVAIAEREIHFTSPPGGTSQKDFYSVMRKMIPDGDGTSLSGSWINGQVQTFNFAVPIPAYIYNLGQLEVAAWIQDDVNKEVLQAGYGSPLPPATPDLGILDISGFSNGCDDAIDPVVLIKNFGNFTVTSCNIQYTTDGISFQNYGWTGSLAPGDSINVNLPTVYTSTSSAINFETVVEYPNGAVDWNNTNNTYSEFFILTNPDSALMNVSEGFQNVVFPPQYFTIHNPDQPETWQKGWYGGFGLSSLSATLPFFYILPGNVDFLYLPDLDFSTAASPLSIEFDIAHASYSAAEMDSLLLEISTDCGANWNVVYSRSGATLSTTTFHTWSFTPTPAEWRTDGVDLSAYVGQPQVMIRFKGISDYGNNLFLDNINLSSGTGLEDLENNSIVNVYPNPFHEQVVFSIEGIQSNSYTLEVFNLVGEVLIQTTFTENTYVMNRNSMAAGIYLYTITSGEKLIKSGQLVVE